MAATSRGAEELGVDEEEDSRVDEEVVVVILVTGVLVRTELEPVHVINFAKLEVFVQSLAV